MMTDRQAARGDLVATYGTLMAARQMPLAVKIACGHFVEKLSGMSEDQHDRLVDVARQIKLALAQHPTAALQMPESLSGALRRFFATHIPSPLAPASTRSLEAKAIAFARNPHNGREIGKSEQDTSELGARRAFAFLTAEGVTTVPKLILNQLTEVAALQDRNALPIELRDWLANIRPIEPACDMLEPTDG